MRSRIAEYSFHKHLILFRMAMEISMSLNAFISVTSWSVNKRFSADFSKSRSAPLCVGLVPYFALPTRRLRVRVVGKALPTLSEDTATHGVLPSSETSLTDRPRAGAVSLRRINWHRLGGRSKKNLIDRVSDRFSKKNWGFPKGDGALVFISPFGL